VDAFEEVAVPVETPQALIASSWLSGSVEQAGAPVM
jgi:hypothetical protein